MTTGILHDQKMEKQIEKQMGCMTGIFHLFDRHHILNGKRLTDTKHLPPAPADDSTPVSEKSVGSPGVSRDLEKSNQTRAMTSPSQYRSKAYPVMELRSSTREVVTPVNSTLPLPIFELKDGTRSSWKFYKDTPRLSLDSRAFTDAKGSLYPKEIPTNTDSNDQRRSPSVIARLMGLEPLLPHSNPEPVKKTELRRSAFESRASRDFLQYRSIDGNNFQPKQQNQSHNVLRNSAETETTTASLNVRKADPKEYATRNSKPESTKPSYRGGGASWKAPRQRKSEEFFPEPNEAVTICREIEKRLKRRVIDDQSKDLESVKQILEILQLKGLLRSPSHQISYESPIVLMRPSQSPVSPIILRLRNDSPQPGFSSRAGVRRSLNYACECSPTTIPRREQPESGRKVRNQTVIRNSRSPTRRENNTRSPNSPSRRASPVHSPKLSQKRNGSNQTITTPSPRNKKPTAEIDPNEKIVSVTEDGSSSVSEISVRSPSQTETERSKMEEYKGGRSLPERCDKLLHSTAEMTATELQPSPVSVLDKYESSSPSPVMKRSIDFKDHLGESEEEIWSRTNSPIQSNCDDESDDCDFVYVSEILRVSSYLPDDSDTFILLEKKQYLQGNDTSEVSRLHRKQIFDTVTEILHRNRQFPRSKVLSWSNSIAGKPSRSQIWSEFQRIRERDSAEGLLEMICGVLQRDLAGDAINGWGCCHVETSETVLDIERLIFRDLVGEAIEDLAVFSGNSRASAPSRKPFF
ncbi:Protein LONGIFOLIA like [Actinidia chinensis var. chinensis]|uniref:Protein LONGIFOLIA like n=1 Tax=Actinidia chinensis var. chinensis TaxID=1590841 RepID=A0A2R6QTZ2_ACTCC|nr:Protein LONGIFOLIA like [Actinidia chinensis var. chinensis]